MEEEETEENSAERKLREKEDEIRKLEEKRKLLENYYKKKLQEKVVSDNIEEKSKVKSRPSTKKKRKVEDNSDSEDENSSGSSSSSSGRHRHKRKRRSKSKSKRSKHRSHGRSRNESKKHKRKSRRRSSSSSSSYSENLSSNVSSRSTSEKPVAKHKKSDKFSSIKGPKNESSNEFQSTEAAIKKLLESSKASPHPPAQIKVKSISQLIEDKGEEAEEVFSDTDQLEGKSFLESVENLHKITSKSSEKTSSHSGHKHKKSSSSDKKSKSSSHKSSSSSSRHKPSSSSSRHKSHHKSSSSHKSSKDKSRKSERKPREVEESKEDKSPLPDFSEELAMLPDFSLEDTGDNFDNISDGLEEMFAGVEDEDELQRIFQQYEPEATAGIDSASLKKQKQLDEREKSAASSSVLGKRRVAHGGPEASEKRPLHMKKPSLRTPAQAMHDRYKKLQQMRQQQMIEKKLTELTEEPADDPGEGPSSSMPGKVRIAHTGSSPALPPVMNKARQQLMAREKVRAVAATPAVTNTKGSQRVAHTPATETVRRPMVTPDRSSKVPTTVRQKYLNSIIEECLKISGGDELEAYTRAEREEKECCRKATSRMFYLNLIVNCIKKLRTEAAAVASRSSRPRPPTESLTEKRNLLTTHLQVLAGKKGTIGTWSNERTANLSVSDVDEKLLFAVMKKYVMTEEQLVENGYPRADPTDPSRVTMKKDRFGKVDPEKARLVAMDDEKRLCDRCGEIYLVSEDGRQITSQQCVYHWGRLFKRKGNRGEHCIQSCVRMWQCLESDVLLRYCLGFPCQFNYNESFRLKATSILTRPI